MHSEDGAVDSAIAAWAESAKPRAHERNHPPQAAETPARAEASDALPFRAAPHNIEAEQALLGAILVNNEAHDRVSGFLEAHHFYDPLHQQIYETLSKLIASGKQATPITLRTFFENAEPIDATTTVPVYLGQLAVNATTIINARDYGRTIHDLYTRRQLIMIGEDVVNKAYDSPVDFPPKEQIEEVETRLFSLAETDKYGQGFLAFNTALTTAIEHGRQRLQARRAPLRHRHPLRRARRQDGRAAVLRPDRAGRTPVDGQDGARHQHRLQRGARARAVPGAAAELPPDDPRHDGAVVGFFSLEMSAEQLATRILSEQAGIPSEKIRRGMIDEPEFKRLVEVSQEMAAIPLLHRPDRRPVHRAAVRARPQAQAPAGPRPPHRRLPAADDGHLQARATTACRRCPRSPPASRRSPRS